MINKKITAVILALAMVSGLAACTSEAEPVSSDVNVISTQEQNGGDSDVTFQAVTVDENAASENYIFTYEGVDVIVNTSMNDILDSLNAVAGEPAYFEVPSCAGEGKSKTFTYNGGSFTISTNSDGTIDVIASIAIYDDSVATPEGIYIGSTTEEVEAAYGTPTSSTDSNLTYEKGSSTLVFVVSSEGTVTNIIYNANY